MSEEQNEKMVEYETNISLPVNDWISLMRKCGEFGISIEELLKGFIEDLVGGTYSNGSDERNLADQWLRRAYQTDNSLLGWLLTEYIGDVDGFIDLLGDIETGKKELEYYKKHPEEYDAEEIDFLNTDMEDWEDTLRECKADYLRFNPTADWDEEINKVKNWYGKIETVDYKHNVYNKFVLELPCGVGDTLYKLNIDGSIDKIKVVSFGFDIIGELYFYYDCTKSNVAYRGKAFISDIGEYIFLDDYKAVQKKGEL